MITSEMSQAQLAQYKEIWHQYKNRLFVNRKSGEQLIQYLKSKYDLTIYENHEAKKAAEFCILANAFTNEKRKDDAAPNVQMYYIEKTKASASLYAQTNAFLEACRRENAMRILVSVDLASGYYQVEGSPLLWDELCVYQGVDEFDIQNFVCVGEYVNCLKRFNLLEKNLKEENND